MCSPICKDDGYPSPLVDCHEDFVLKVKLDLFIRERRGKRALICWFTLHLTTAARARPRLEPGTGNWNSSLRGCQCPKYLRHHLQPIRVCLSRKLQRWHLNLGTPGWDASILTSTGAPAHEDLENHLCEELGAPCKQSKSVHVAGMFPLHHNWQLQSGAAASGG